MEKCIRAIMCLIFVLAMAAGCGARNLADSETTGAGQGNMEAGRAWEESSAKSGSETETKELEDRPVIELGSMYIRETDKSGDLVYVSGSHDTLRLSKDSAGQYKDLAGALEKYMTSETRYVKKEIEEYKKAHMDNPENFDGEKTDYDITDKCYVRRADRRVLSILEYAHRYMGGVHGDYGYSSLNLDARTGREITLDDVITDRKKLIELLGKKLIEAYGKDAFFEDMGETIEKEVKGEEDMELTWTLDPQGITFYFDPYEIASYAEGAHCVTLLYTSAKDLFTEKYRPEEKEGYICGIPWATETWVDTDQDGTAEQIGLSYDMEGETDTIQSLTVLSGKKELTVKDIYCYEVQPVIVLTPEGKTFLYAWCTSDNDYVNIYPFDLTGKSPVSSDPLALAETCTYEEEEKGDYITYKRLATDPGKMLLGSRFDLLSTYSACKTYYLKDSPVPETKDPYYMIVGEITLTSVKEITADVTDESGEVLQSSVKVPSGTEWKLYRTDGSKTVDAVLGDGRIVRLTVTGGYPQSVNGVNAEELFEQLFYAG